MEQPPPDQPRPDTKDWTWVLERPCPQCGYDVSVIERSRLGARLRANAAQWRQILSRSDLVAERPPTEAGQGPVWSALEYGAHVRDVYGTFVERLERMLTEDDPTFADRSWDQLAIDQRYHEADPGRVSYELAVDAGRVADMIDRVHGDQWQRLGHRSDGAAFTVETLSYYLLHDVTHHAWDAEQGFEAIAEARASEEPEQPT